MLKRAVMIVQQHLKDKGLYLGAVDGAAGPITEAAVTKGLTLRQGELPAGSLAFPAERRMTLMLQLICKDKGIECEPIDGYWGPVTQFAYESILQLQNTGTLPDNWRDDEPSDANPHRWPRDTGNQAEMRAFFGPPGNPPIKRVRCPWSLKLAWDTRQKVTHIGCHAKVADSVESGAGPGQCPLRREEKSERLHLDLYGGCFFSRKKRGGSTWSTHAWAVALDWDPYPQPAEMGARPRIA